MYSYDRRTAAFNPDTFSKAAETKLKALVQISDTLKKLAGKSGASWGSRESKALTAAMGKVLKLGDAVHKAGARLEKAKFDVTRATKPALQNLDTAMREWNSSAFGLANKNYGFQHEQENQAAQQLVGFVGEMIVGILDLAEAIKTDDPNTRSVHDRVMSKL
jgi:hypothetical protein